MDTGVALTSLPIDSSTRKTISSLYHTDSIWVKTIPIVYFARIIAGQAEVTDTLYYYSKTGPTPGPSSPLFPNFDKGDMTYAAININKQNSVDQLPLRSRARTLLSVCVGPGATMRIMIGAQAGGELSICDIAGKTVRRFGTINNTSAIVWDQTTSAGARVNPGVYVVRLHTQEQSAAQVVRIAK
jgi:hypothetical protein